MEWLVLANGDAKGFTKFRVGSVKPEGICGNFDGTEWYAPDMSTVRK